MTRVVRLMTYNVHGCVGVDKRLDVGRIAAVIAQNRPDIVALQELDVGRARSGRVDQAHEIAGRLGMRVHFNCAFRVEEEQYGDAILTPLPPPAGPKRSPAHPAARPPGAARRVVGGGGGLAGRRASGAQHSSGPRSAGAEGAGRRPAGRGLGSVTRDGAPQRRCSATSTPPRVTPPTAGWPPGSATCSADRQGSGWPAVRRGPSRPACRSCGSTTCSLPPGSKSCLSARRQAPWRAVASDHLPLVAELILPATAEVTLR